MDLVKRLYEDKLITDDRSPAFSFDFAGREIDLVPPNYLFYIQVALLMFIQMSVGCLLALTMYFGIVHGKSSTLQKYLIGYGIVIPIGLWFPFLLFDWLDVRSVTLRLALCTLPMTITLRCLETMYGFMSHEKSLKDYVVSVGCLLRPQADPNTDSIIPLTMKSFVRSLRKYFSWMMTLALLNQFLAPYNYYPFSTSVNTHEIAITFDLAALYNAYAQLVFMNFSLAFSTTGVSAMAALLTGVTFNDFVTDFPLFFSRSHSEFWGLRWNNLIHDDLKQGVYKPVRRISGSKMFAAICTFVVSGLQHEYVWWLLFTPTANQLQEPGDDNDCCLTCYCQAWFGRQTLLFTYAGIWMALECFFGTLPKFNNLLFTLLESHLFLLLLFLPVAHNFTVDLTSSGYFHSLQHAFPAFLVRI